jgi:hypothetical protein
VFAASFVAFAIIFWNGLTEGANGSASVWQSSRLIHTLSRMKATGNNRAPEVDFNE